MDFDDMEDSYFAFLGNSKKIVTDNRFNAIVQDEVSSGSERKMRTRGGGSNPGNSGSKPGGAVSSTSSLPSIPALPTRPGASTNTPTNNVPQLAASMDSSRNIGPVAQNEARPAPMAMAQPASKMSMSWILVGVLLISALGIFGFVIFGK